ncbi:MAG: glycosyltransferase family 2 protein [Fermentimonas sp.]|jgi:GT2 family glycosyltransferase|uniref:glycosyltransferase family 2 protein n=1 Tax=Lascolabacillus sp. TaxID=1924068 RepID=UPI001B5F4F98|nr:glycosyltransferase family 2 protein [Lascolabacillus sp.]MBP6197127.1 glycosyltransferase family 2 protein [Fermentimonas sp.]MCK9501754.1 glycosyltransferase family 2 protein [Lascolabacillus sp.]MDD2607800.1 glycosyltransferase family 2 protein [Lascolabacillus sp.]MDD3658999.1 glycosyltransferase family 2 protein [Lascolabacillus sp.]MDD4758749.1 glycosyltransferase family 2 protein [Lascolabacillus sp.]
MNLNHNVKASVVILNWNGKRLLEQFLPIVIKHTQSDISKVIVSDNGSTDDSVRFMKENYPEIQLVTLDKNYGFAEGYNKTLHQVNSEYVVLLNSDVETTEGWLQNLITYMDNHPEVAAVQPKILSYKEKYKFEYAGASGGFIDRYGYPFCRGRILDKVENDKGQYDNEIPVFWATGACLCIRLKDYFEMGGLDGSFFAHMEEIDLCWRLNARGRKVMCIPSSIVYHVGGASLSKDNPKKMYLNFRNNLLMLYKNLPNRSLPGTFLVRFVFDILAYFHLIFKGEFKNAYAIIEAYRDFFNIFNSYKQKRIDNLKKTTQKSIATQYKRSILLKFYTGKKLFNSIIWK